MTVIPFSRNPGPLRAVRRPSIREQLDGLRCDLAAASAETPDMQAADEFISAARRLRQIIERMEAGQ